MFQQHFQPNENKYDSNSLLQMRKFVDRTLQQEKQRPQTENRKDVTGIDDHIPLGSIGYNCKNGRNRVKSKHNICSGQQHNHHKYVSVVSLAIDLKSKLAFVVL